MPHAAAHAGDEPGVAGRIIGIHNDGPGTAGHVAGSAGMPGQGLVLGRGELAGLGHFPVQIAGLVFGHGPVRRNPHLVQDAREFFGVAHAGIFGTPVLKLGQLGFQFEGVPGPRRGVGQGFLQACLFGLIPGAVLTVIVRQGRVPSRHTNQSGGGHQNHSKGEQQSFHETQPQSRANGGQVVSGKRRRWAKGKRVISIIFGHFSLFCKSKEGKIAPINPHPNPLKSQHCDTLTEKPGFTVQRTVKPGLCSVISNR